MKISFWTLPLDESIDDMNLKNLTIEMTAMATYFSCKITVRRAHLCGIRIKILILFVLEKIELREFRIFVLLRRGQRDPRGRRIRGDFACMRQRA